MNHMTQQSDVDPAGGDISGDQILNLTSLHLLHNTLTLSLIHISTQAFGVKASLREMIGELLCFTTCIDEYNRVLRALMREDL